MSMSTTRKKKKKNENMKISEWGMVNKNRINENKFIFVEKSFHQSRPANRYDGESKQKNEK